MSVIKVEPIQGLSDHSRVISRFAKEEDIRRVLPIDLLQALDCCGVPQPTTVPAKYH